MRISGATRVKRIQTDETRPRVSRMTTIIWPERNDSQQSTLLFGRPSRMLKLEVEVQGGVALQGGDSS